MKHIMVDLETLGTVADSVICSIGAVKFDLDSNALDDAGFYASVSVDSNLEMKRRIQEDTLIWWMKQTSEAQQVFVEPKQTLRTALEELSEWIGPGDFHLWSNGADFDLPMLSHAFTQHMIEIPWKFHNQRCYRTYKTLPQARQATKPAAGVKHNAMADALNQAQHLQAIQRVVTGREAFKQNSMVKTA